MRALRAAATAVFLWSVWSAHAQIAFDSDFECGNGTAFTEIGPNEYSFTFEPDTNATDRQWFMFRVTGAAGESLAFRLTGTDRTNVRRHWSRAHPVASTDGGATWAPVAGPTSNEDDTFLFSHAFTADPEYIAFHHPYTVTRANERIAAWAEHPHVARRTLGASVEGRPIELLAVTDGSASPEGGKLGFWIIARQHAAEVSGSWMCEGFMDFLLSDDPCALDLRRRAVTNVVPMMNPDGVIAGNYRQNAAGVNLNRSWSEPSAETSPEVLAVVEAIDAWVEAGNSYVFLGDLHSTSGGTTNFAFRPAEGVEPPLYSEPERYAEHMSKLLALMQAAAPDFSAEAGASRSLDPRLARQHQMFRHGVLALTFEGTYNAPDYGPHAGEVMTPERHREIGRAMGLALWDFFDLGTPAEPAEATVELRSD